MASLILGGGNGWTCSNCGPCRFEHCTGGFMLSQYATVVPHDEARQCAYVGFWCCFGYFFSKTDDSLQCKICITYYSSYWFLKFFLKIHCKSNFVTARTLHSSHLVQARSTSRSWSCADMLVWQRFGLLNWICNTSRLIGVTFQEVIYSVTIL